MNNHYYDENGVYTASAPVNPGTIAPANALRVPPPERSGYWPVLNAARDGWDMAEDHRGRRGWLDGRAITLAGIGPLPEGWSDLPANAPDVSNGVDHRELRAAAYVAEADPLRDAALSYQAEAEGWRLAGEAERERLARVKAEDNLRRYTATKEEIRLRYPAPAAKGDVPGDGAGEGTARTALYYLTGSGTYHGQGCPSTRAAGEWLSLEEILKLAPGARPCGRCKPTMEK